MASSRKSRVLALAGFVVVASSCASLARLFGPGGGQDSSAHKRTGPCIHVAPELPTTTLTACESASTYEVTTTHEHYIWAKASFQRAFRERLLAFVQTTNYPWKTLRLARISFWLRAPLLHPEDAAFVAFVEAPRGNFSMRLPLNPAEWNLADPSRLAWLGHDLYPSRASRRVDTVVLVGAPLVTGERLQSFLANSGALAVHTASGAPAVRQIVGAGGSGRDGGDGGEGTALSLATEPFAEQAVLASLKAAPESRRILGELRYEPTGDGEAYEARVFRFLLNQN